MKAVSIEWGGKQLTIETGRFAHLATGAVTVRYGDTVILATATIADKPRPDVNFFPLLIDYEERFYASGKLSGSRFMKREGRPSEDATLTARLIDRPLRPMFPKHFRNDVQVVLTVLSADLKNDPDIVAIVAASSALMLTNAPFTGPVAGIRVGLIDGQFVVNPTHQEMVNSSLDLVVAGTATDITMIEAGANEVDEATLMKAFEFGHQNLQPALQLQQQLLDAAGKSSTKTYEVVDADLPVEADIRAFVADKIESAIYHADKTTRQNELALLQEAVIAKFVDDENPQNLVLEVLESVLGEAVKKNILESNRRPDGRKLTEVRPLDIAVDLLPITHGSAMFKRGETQALSIVTLGSVEEAQLIDTMEQETSKLYMHHYNFPPFATGEVKPMRTPGRREIGHGALAERALLPVIPGKDEFPYTIRVVSEVLASNGSSSMASTCGSTLSLMAAGVPIKKPVSGVAMGLMYDKKTGNYKIITDLAGIEDFNGDMDYKVAGTKDGITAIQLDMKQPGLKMNILQEALTQAKQARLEILEAMLKVIPTHRDKLAENAPKVVIITIDPTRIGEVIGPGGKVINQIIDSAGGKEQTSISIDPDGKVFITAHTDEDLQKARQAVEGIVKVVQAGEIYTGRVVKVMDFGAFVEILPGKDGLVHISELSDKRVEKVTDVVQEGDMVTVKVKEIDNLGRINLSIKAAKQSQ
jgi:polyribonucleotide nucleotidyltransferase